MQALVQATNFQCPIVKRCETLAIMGEAAHTSKKNGALNKLFWKDERTTRYGVKTYENGNVYNGSWVDEKRNGEGVLTLPNGGVYNGSWVDDTRAGEAQCVKTSKTSGLFEQFHFAAKVEKSSKNP